MKNYNQRNYSRVPKAIKLKADRFYEEYCNRPPNPEQDAEFQKIWDESNIIKNNKALEKYIKWEKKYNPSNLI